MTNIICVAAQQRGVYCQTFIRAHIERLPARTVRELYITELAAFADDRPGIIKKFLIDGGVEVLLAEFGDTGVDVMEACHAAGVPLVVRFGGADAYCETGKWHYLRPYYLPLFNSSASIVAVSRDMERQLVRLGVPPTKLHYCPSGADTELFQGAKPASAAPIFMSVGRFVDKKAPDLTLWAFAKVFKACPEARLIMVGGGYLLQACKRLARVLGLEDAVEFRGECLHQEVAAIMRGARCFVQHSIRASNGDSEGTPNSVMEAGACGLAVVATRHAGIADVVIDGETGLLVDEGDVNCMAQHMLRLALDEKSAGRLGERARERVCREFSLDRSIGQLWDIMLRAKRSARIQPSTVSAGSALDSISDVD